jgi:UDP-N-acetyl-2-amino-2-deoxyglucuronate dehydrogenase
MGTSIKFGICGLGHIGKRHAAIIHNLPACSLEGLCDVRPMEDLGLDEAYLNTPFYPSLAEMLEQSDLDLVCLATPNGLHEPQALQALEAGKHVLIEKPMALSKAACERIIFKALEKNRQVFCVMQNRYSPPAKWLKGLIEQKVMGEILQIQINCFWNRDDRYYRPGGWHGTRELDGGVLFTQFSHFIVGFELANGALGSLQFSTAVWDANFESSLTVLAEKGSLKIGGQYMNKVEYCHIEGYQMPQLPPANPPNQYGAYQGSAANHHFVFQNVADVLRGRDSIATNALEGMKVVDIIERIHTAAGLAP